MARTSLILTLDPSGVETYLRFKTKDGEFKLKTAMIDTGAEQSSFPLHFLDLYETKIIHSQVQIDQAGIAKQGFTAIEAEITLYLEDSQGNTSPEIQVRAWFAETEEIILGFKDFLDRAILFVDYLDTRTGWLEIR